MNPVRSAFERRWKALCGWALLGACCHAHADSGATDGAGDNRPPKLPGVEDVRLHSGDLLGFKKYFSKDRLLSRLGFFGYSATPTAIGFVNGDGRAVAAMESGDSGGAAPGRMKGYMLNLNLQPLALNSDDAHYGGDGFTYFTRPSDPLRQGWTAKGVKYALSFDDCLRLEGIYGRSARLERFGLGLAQDNWSVSLAGGAGMAVQVGYSIPLGRSTVGAAACNAEANAGRLFGANGWLAQ